VYADGPPRGPVALEAIVDAGKRPRPRSGQSQSFTRLRRTIPLGFARLEGARYLNRAQGPVWASAPVFVPLGDDLPRGSHLVALRLRGLDAHPMARFFSYGGPVASRINQ